MTAPCLTREFLAQALDALPPHPARIVAFSGGPDSLALLHCLARIDSPVPVRAVHVDHGLDGGSTRRAKAAAALAESLGVPFSGLTVSVDPRDRGLEAAARRARYDALADIMQPGDCLLTAHHADDQAETLLLQLMRGAGPRGLAGMPAAREFGPGQLARPLLTLARTDILAYIEHHGLSPLDDPGNRDPARDRNFLRHEILPRLTGRWPEGMARLNHAAALQRDAARAVNDLARIDLAACGRGPGRLDLAALLALPAYRRIPVLMRLCRVAGIRPPPARRLDELMAQAASARADRCPEIRWDDHALHIWRGRLFLVPRAGARDVWCVDWDGAAPLELPGRRGRLTLDGGRRLPAEWRDGLRVGARAPGEAITLAPGTPRHLKGLMQAAGIPPWERADWPVVRRGDRVLACGDRWLDHAFAESLRTHGLKLDWERDPTAGDPPDW